MRDADGRKIVEVTGLEGSARADGEEVTFEVEDGCGTIAVDGDEQSGCIEDLRDQLGSEGAGVVDMAERLSDPKLPFAVSEVDGKWYVSPTFTLGEIMLELLRTAEPGDVRSMFDSLESGMNSGFDLGPSLNSDIFGGLSGPGTGTSGFELDDEGDIPADESDFGTDGYSLYFDACGDLEFAVLDATTNEEWRSAVTLASACAAPFVAAGDIVPSDLLEEVAYPDCYPSWPFDPNLTLEQQGQLFEDIEACVAPRR